MTLPAEVMERMKKPVFRTPGLTPIGQAAQTAVKRLEKNPGAVFRYARRTSQA
ncbi:MAG TPA: hypothetical protein VNY05_02355 [Candidatus Acidoferrales bacterium]|jgi:hypothetical protein|nr:hypothetical protein [Candidatus Acidoferrales bacterium]